MITVFTMFLLLGVGWGPVLSDESTDTFSAPGDGLGLAPNHSRTAPTSVPPSGAPRVPFPGAGLGGLGGLAAAAGLAAQLADDSGLVFGHLAKVDDDADAREILTARLNAAPCCKRLIEAI